MNHDRHSRDMGRKTKWQTDKPTLGKHHIGAKSHDDPQTFKKPADDFEDIAKIERNRPDITQPLSDTLTMIPTELASRYRLDRHRHERMVHEAARLRLKRPVTDKHHFELIVDRTKLIDDGEDWRDVSA